jgi:hypothetical protein
VMLTPQPEASPPLPRTDFLRRVPCRRIRACRGHKYLVRMARQRGDVTEVRVVHDAVHSVPCLAAALAAHIPELQGMPTVTGMRRHAWHALHCDQRCCVVRKRCELNCRLPELQTLIICSGG